MDMKIVLVCIICGILCLPLLSNGEKLYLRDGSILNGTIETLKADSVRIKTSFGTRITISREDIYRIEFIDSIPPTPAAAGQSLVTAEPGSLHVLFASQELSSKIVVHRGKDETLCRDANSIDQKLIIDDELQFAYADTVTDKKIRKGAETIYKNTIKLQDIKISLPAGMHTMRLVIGSRGRIEQEHRFETEPLLESLERNNLVIYPGKTTKLVIEVDRRKWGMGKTELSVRE
jgi:hypothetical protein